MRADMIPMVPDRKSSMPRIYGDTPSFLGVPVATIDKIEDGTDVVIAGVPYEGTITWGTFSGCELAPRYARHAAARYGGFLPEYEVDLFDHLKLVDVGDISVDPNNAKLTMSRVFEMADKIYKQRAIPVVLGGDHSFTPEVVRALAKNSEGEIGLIHFDSHFDNSECFGEDEYPRCGPIYRISKIDRVNPKAIVHLGIRGPRNSKAQLNFARKIGATIFTITEVHKRGIEKTIQEALRICRQHAKHIYVTICSDILDAAYNPGGPADFDGFSPSELFYAVNQIGREGISGFDYVEVYPIQDPNHFSSHMTAWTIIHALVGLAIKKSLSK